MLLTEGLHVIESERERYNVKRSGEDARKKNANISDH